MQQNQQERRERKNQIPKRKKGKLPSDFTPPPEETMLHKGKQKHRAEWRHMEESKMAKINKCCRNETELTEQPIVSIVAYHAVNYAAREVT
ncbi:hypothetical protein NQZ68_012641 [Dissostichus eleginoides]|nr:hypothetical protein NQZ68_012641 [Dissostichus eleginoides]